MHFIPSYRFYVASKPIPLQLRIKIEIPDLNAKASGLNEQELRSSLAVKLYDDEKISLSQGSQLSGISQDDFLDLLVHHGATLKYDS
ncbi:UPF0175 family protein [Aurantivibrio plasticivorans]